MKVSSPSPRTETREVAKGGRRRHTEKGEQETKKKKLYREELLGEGQPSPWSGRLKVAGRVHQKGTEES